jgi:RHS repeat-associated protein
MAEFGHRAVGHPVDVATGVLFTAAREADVRGAMALKFRRFYSTALLVRPSSPLGLGWTSSLFQKLYQDLDGYRLTGEEGGIVAFDSPVAQFGGVPVSVNVAACMELTLADAEAIITHWHYASANVVQYVFGIPAGSTAAPLRAIRNFLGGELQFKYDSQGNLVEVVQLPEARSLLFRYDDQHRITALLLRGSSRTPSLLANYSYDDRGNLVAVGDSDGVAILYEYDELHRMVAETNRVGMRYEMQYDSDGRCIKTEGANRFKSRTLTYDPTGLKTTVVDAFGQVTVFELNPRGQVLKETSPKGAVRSAEYDLFGRMISRTDPLGRTTAFTYDARGNLVQVKEESGGTQTLEYDETHMLTAQTQASGNRWLWRYDDHHRLAEAENPLGAIIRYGRDSDRQGLLTMSRGGSIRLDFGDNGDKLRLHNGNGNSAWQQSLDVFGQVTASVDPLGRQTRYGYSHLGTLTSIEEPDGAVTQGSADALGRIRLWNDASGRVTRLEYDLPTGRIARITLPSGRDVTFSYDLEGRLVRITNQKGEQASIEYDADGYVVGQVFFDGHREGYERDLAGQLLAILDDGGRATRYKRNSSGLVTEKVAPDGSKTTYTYSSSGLMLSATNATTSVEFEYDALGRRAAEVCENRRVEYRYDAAGQLIHQHYVSGTLGPVALAYDEFSRLKSLSARGRMIQQFRWDAMDRLAERRLFTGVIESFTYDQPFRAVRQDVRTSNGGTLVSREYHRDRTGNLDAVVDRGEVSMAFAYDADERVVQERRGNGQFAQYSYDSTGNLISDGVRGYRYSRGGRLESSNGAPTGDGRAELGAGEPGFVGHGELEYDSENRLASFRTPGGSTATYEYDPFGRRIRKTVNGSTTTFVWAGYDLIAETSDTQQREYLNFGFCSFGEWSKGQLFASVLSPRFAPTELIDETGHTAWSGEYNALGQLVSETATGHKTNLRAAGQYADAETGLYYNIQRYFDPALGRFTTPDPVGLAGGLNSFTLPKNVVNWIDPLGFECGRTDIVHFGQIKVSAEFSGGGDFNGQSLDEVAAALRADPSKVDDMVVHYVVDPNTGEKITINNRSLTVISMAGLSPTNTVDVTGTLPATGRDSVEDVNGRLAEIGDRGRTSIGIRAPGTPWDSPAVRSVSLPGFPPAGSGSP